jgi:hypothetical protein
VLTPEQVDTFQATQKLEIEGFTMGPGDLDLKKSFKGESATIKGHMEDGVLVLLNTELDAELVSQRVVREFVNRVQKMRKAGQLMPADKLEIFYEVLKGPKKQNVPLEVLQTRGSAIAAILGTPAPVPMAKMSKNVRASQAAMTCCCNELLTDSNRCGCRRLFLWTTLRSTSMV